MNARSESEAARMKNRTTVERTSDREVVVTRTFDAPARLVFEAWTRPELFKQWWVPRSMDMFLRSCEMDVRVGGGYKLAFGHDPSSSAEFFGRYLDVTPNASLAWTNDEDHAGEQVTTVTFEERDGRTTVTVRDRYPSKDALDAAIAAGSSGIDAMPEQLQQLDELLVSVAASGGPS